MENIRINELMESNRLKEMKAICRFINTANFDELAKIIEEIRCCHDNLYAFNPDTKLFAKIESISLNGECIQLNIEKEQQ